MKYGFTEVGTWVGRLVKKGGFAADVSGGTMKKTRMVMIRAPGLPLHTSGHSGKCRCHKKEEPCTWGRRQGANPPPPASSRARGKAKCREFEGREEERCELLLEGTLIFWRWEKLGGGRGFGLGGIFLGLRRRN